MQQFTTPQDGTYKLEVWGAQGGYATNIVISDSNLGKGGYSYGTIYLLANTKLYVCVGSSGLSTTTGGYNGGSIAHTVGGAGGGATHIALTNRGVLTNYSNYQNEVLIVAGGGGGVDYYGISGYGGGTTGGNGYYNNITCTGGTQMDGGSGTYFGSFGKGACGDAITDWGSGGGGGWYGGGGTDIGSGGGAGGGSGHINAGVTGTTIAGDQSFPSPTGGTEIGHNGNGYCVISWIP